MVIPRNHLDKLWSQALSFHPFRHACSGTSRRVLYSRRILNEVVDSIQVLLFTEALALPDTQCSWGERSLRVCDGTREVAATRHGCKLVRGALTAAARGGKYVYNTSGAGSQRGAAVGRGGEGDEAVGRDGSPPSISSSSRYCAVCCS